MLHIIQNDPEVPPGNIAQNLHVPYALHHPYRGNPLPELRDITALIVLGGAMGANEEARYPFLVAVKQLIRQLVAAAVPYLGICLGGQLLATAMGAQVISGRWEELGSLPVALTDDGRADPLFRGVPDQFGAFQWHQDSFDIPDAGILLASSSACPHQAFRIGECAWGIQFHPEVTEKIIRDWCSWDDSTAMRTEELIAAFNSRVEEYRKTARCLLSNFLNVAGLGQR